MPAQFNAGLAAVSRATSDYLGSPKLEAAVVYRWFAPVRLFATLLASAALVVVPAVFC